MSSRPSYDHTDAMPGRRALLRSTAPCRDPFVGLEPGDLTHVPGDWKHNPYDTSLLPERIGY